MSQPSPPQKAGLIVSVLLHEKAMFPMVSDALAQEFGEVDISSPWFDFDYTDYYAAEMGTPLYRRMLAFKQLIEQASLPEIKCRTNELEIQHAVEGRRRFNLDPGYLLLERFVLATGKNFTHRIYIGENIYADLTLIYQKGAFQVLPWTYPDYASKEMHDFLIAARQSYSQTLVSYRRNLSHNKGEQI